MIENLYQRCKYDYTLEVGNISMFTKTITTVMPFPKYLALALFFIFPFVGFYLGMSYSAKIVSSSKSDYTSYEIEYLQTMKNLNSCLSREACLEQRGEYIGNETVMYSPEFFRLDSSLLTGKDVVVTTYRYCNTDITSKEIQINGIWITVWEPGSVLFGGYENYSNRIRDQIDIEKHKGVEYISQKEIHMVLTDSHEKSFDSAMFTFHKPIEGPSYKSPGSYYVEIGHQKLFGRSYKSPESAQDFQELKEFVDTLSPVPYHNWMNN